MVATCQLVYHIIVAHAAGHPHTTTSDKKQFLDKIQTPYKQPDLCFCPIRMSAGVCGSCYHMCDEQVSVECVGPCAARYHLSCVNIGIVERDFFIVDGVSIYKCHNCSRRRNNDMCVTSNARNVKAAKSSFLPTQDKPTENNLECSLVDRLNVLKENCDSMFLLLKEILNETGQISNDLSVLKSENVALKCLLTEFLKENKSWSSMKSDSAIFLTKYIQSSSENATDSCADGPSQGTVAAEDSCLKIVHKKIRMQRAEFLSPLSKSPEKILKMEAHFNSGVSASGLKPKMKALLDIKAYEVNSVVEF